MTDWIKASQMLPGYSIEWCVVLTIDSDRETFSFMARYNHSDGEWRYFDDDKGYEESMIITHWQPLLCLPE